MDRSGEHFPWLCIPLPFSTERRLARGSYMNKGDNYAMERFLCQANGTDDTLDYS